MAEKRTTARKSTAKRGPRSRPTKRPAQDENRPAAVAPASPAPPPAPVRPTVPPPVASTRWTLGATLVATLVVLAVAAAVVGGLWLRGNEEKTFKLDLGVPTALSADDLRAFASPGRPVYWVGPANSGTLEVTRTSRGAVYVRYLPTGVAVGDRAPSYTTIATYSTPDAYATMQRSAATQGFRQSEAANGGLAVWRVAKATSVYLAYPKSDYLVEVYDPSPRRARTVALSARVRQVP